MIPIIITKDIIDINQFSRDGHKLKDKKGFVMHYTADKGAPAQNISRYFRNLKLQNPNDDIKDRYAGAQFSVDRYKIVQSIPTDERAYQCGSSQPYLSDAIEAFGAYPNDTTIGIEMCIEEDGSIHEDTFQNAADLVVHLIQTEGFPNTIFTHKGVVGWKDCPLPWVKDPAEFERFKKVVNEKLNQEDDEAMKEQLEAALKRIEVLEAKAKVLDKIPPPEWFVEEFGEHALVGILNDPTGDTNFWRSLAALFRALIKGEYVKGFR